MKKVKWAGLILAVFATGGCASKATMTGDIRDEEAPVAEVSAGDDALGAAVDKSQTPGFAALDSDAAAAPDAGGGLLDERLVFFDYDKSVVLPQYLGMLHAHGGELAQNRRRSVILEGHADERGSNEYNLALGQRRADAVRDVLLADGALAEQIETISFGEERPRALGHSESAWQENRRVEIVYRDE